MAKKRKVYIPPYKIAGLIIIVFSLCLLLLYFSNKSPKENAIKDDYPSIAERFENHKSNESNQNNTSNIEQKNVQQTQIINIQNEKTNNSQNQNNDSINSNKNQNINQNNNSQTTLNPSNTTQNNSTNTTKDNYDFPKAQNNAQLIFVFDDGGQNLSQLDKFLSLPFPITVAVLPKLTHSKQAADKIRKSGNEIILHQPMQAISNSNPGPGAINTNMNEDEIISTLFTNITEIGPVAGMNNHEGSAVTENAEIMSLILRFSSDNGIFFLDSRTNAKTTVPYVAKEMGFSYFERNIFLDNEKTKENALSELKKGLSIANKNGTVIMIGHITSADFLPSFLKEVYPELVKKGYRFSVVSKSNALKY